MNIPGRETLRKIRFGRKGQEVDPEKAKILEITKKVLSEGPGFIELENRIRLKRVNGLNQPLEVEVMEELLFILKDEYEGVRQ